MSRIGKMHFIFIFLGLKMYFINMSDLHLSTFVLSGSAYFVFNVIFSNFRLANSNGEKKDRWGRSPDHSELLPLSPSCSTWGDEV